MHPPMSFGLKNRLILFLLIVVSLILFGSAGYAAIKIYIEHESVSFTDAIYFSVATISTLGHYPSGVGFTSTIGKWFTILYLIFGLAIIFGGVQTIIGPWLEMKIKRAEKGWVKPIPRDAHVIICGYNEIAAYIAKRLEVINVPYVVVDEDPPSDIPHIKGKPTENRVLHSANISRAAAIVSLLDDASNALIALSAKRINPKINIIGVAAEDHYKDILKKAGVDVVISRRNAIYKNLYSWLNKGRKEARKGIKVRRMDADKNLSGKKISEARLREKAGTIIAVYRGKKLIVDPPADFKIKPGDTLIYLEGGEAS